MKQRLLSSLVRGVVGSIGPDKLRSTPAIPPIPSDRCISVPDRLHSRPVIPPIPSDRCISCPDRLANRSAMPHIPSDRCISGPDRLANRPTMSLFYNLARPDVTVFNSFKPKVGMTFMNSQ